VNLADLLRQTAQRLPDKIALVQASDDRSITFGELDREADRVASGLQAHGVANGDRVAIAMSNVIEFPIAYLGVLRAGAVAVPLNSMLTPPEIARVLEDSGAGLAFATPQLAPVVNEAAGVIQNRPTVVVTDRWQDFGAGGSPHEHAISADDLAVLAYTSGTTGEPKGAMLTHGNLLANLEQQMAIPDDRVREDDVLFMALPMFHIFGLNVPLGLLVLNGATGVLVERFEPVAALRAIEQHRVTVLFGAPKKNVAFVGTPGRDQYDLSHVRIAISGAAALPAIVLKAFKDTFGVDIHEGYGMTETAPTLTSNRMAEAPRAGSIGRPLPGVDLRLVDEAGEDVEIGDPGEIVVRGPNVFAGYWQREDETAQVFRDGWFRTGDVAVEDEEGYLYLVDRKRDLIIVSGFNVFPSEVEAALVADPAVAEAVVLGEPHPYTGESVTAWVVLEDGAEATEADLLRNVTSRLARFKCPTRIEIVESLPHLPTGKIMRRALRT